MSDTTISFGPLTMFSVAIDRHFHRRAPGYEVFGLPVAGRFFVTKDGALWRVLEYRTGMGFGIGNKIRMGAAQAAAEKLSKVPPEKLAAAVKRNIRINP